MEIKLLGPLEVLLDGAVSTPSAPKLRTALTLLVVHPNRVVRTDQIIEELWANKPPTSVTTTLQTYIYQLRKLLRLAVPPRTRPARDLDRMAVALHTSANGYVLSLAPEVLDSQHFERLADRGRTELESGDAQAAVETLSCALRLWRGPALVDVFQGPVLQTEILRLEEMHKATLEWRIEAELQLGRHHELLGELTQLSAQQPTHEGFQAKLMLALYRAGRRSEALNVYHRTRNALAGELGLDPSRDVQRLHRAMLTGDQWLDPPTHRDKVRATGRSTPPRQLPPNGPSLVGRDAQVTAALDALSVAQHHAPPVVVITGAPGSGKSALGTQVAHRVSNRYPDGQLCARLLDSAGEPVDPATVLAEFLRSIGVPDERIPDTTGERARLFRTWTADRRVLVSFDEVVTANQLLPLLPSSGGCGVLATSRRRLSAPAVTATVELRPLSIDEGIELLTNVLGECRIMRDEQTVVRELIRRCDGLPAALHTAAARLKVRPHWRLARLTSWISAEIAHPTAPALEALSLYASVERTYRLTPPPVQTAFRMLATLATETISLPTAARTLGVPEDRTEALLDELVEFQLVDVEPGEEPGFPRYRLLASVGAVAPQLPSDDQCLAVDSAAVHTPSQRCSDVLAIAEDSRSAHVEQPISG